jgi:hypothetical protein
MFAAIRRRATSRNLLAAFLSLSAVTLISHLLAVPAYRAFASGFDPFNLQYRLNWQMVAIERGAFSAGIGHAYLTFALLDAIWQILLVVFLMLLWAWIMERTGRQLMSDFLMLFPLLPAGLGIAESACFVMISFADPRDPLHELTDKVLTIHYIKYLMRDWNVVITVVLGAFALYYRWRAPPPADAGQ